MTGALPFDRWTIGVSIKCRLVNRFMGGKAAHKKHAKELLQEITDKIIKTGASRNGGLLMRILEVTEDEFDRLVPSNRARRCSVE